MENTRLTENFLNQANHAVKNNLQLVNSLLSIQARRYKNLTVEDFNKKSENRINTIKLVHNNIYYDRDVIDNVDMSSYVKSLIISLGEIFENKVESINFNIVIDNVVLELKTAISIGLIINELVINSISHAFSNENDTSKNIIIDLSKDIESCILIYKDNGQGFDKNLIQKSLGIEIIELLIQQMNAKHEASSTNGVEYKIWF